MDREYFEKTVQLFLSLALILSSIYHFFKGEDLSAIYLLLLFIVSSREVK